MENQTEFISNPVIGQKIRFLKKHRDTNGKLLEYEIFEQINKGLILPEHVHLEAEERFRVIEGTLTVRMDGEDKQFHAGDEVVIPAGVKHTGWNSGAGELHLHGEIRPALNFEDYYQLTFDLASRNKCNSKGVPKNLLQTAVLMSESDIYLPSMIPVQKVVFNFLGMIGKLFGYKGALPVSKN